MNELDSFLGPRPLNEALVRDFLRGATDIIFHTKTGRVMVHKRGQRVDSPVPPCVAEEIRRARAEGVLGSLLPRVGKNSANVRIRR